MIRGNALVRDIDVKIITQTVKALCIKANFSLPDDLCAAVSFAQKSESYPLCREILSDMLLNLDAAKELNVPICQDTGMAVVFLEIGQDVHLAGGDLTNAVNEGVRQGYVEGRLRCSVVGDPIKRINTNDNTPAVIHISIVPGDKIKITAAPKGFGSENMSAVKMFTPSAAREDIIDFVADTVKTAGANPCPPLVVGVGIGGDFELCAYLAKKALCRNISTRNSDEFYKQMEFDILNRLNSLNIGAQGFGGDTTALAVNIEQYATHIAGLPVAVNMGCHVTRHQSEII